VDDVSPSVEVRASEGVVLFKSVVGAVTDVFGGVTTDPVEVDSVSSPTVVAPGIPEVDEAASVPFLELIPELTPEIVIERPDVDPDGFEALVIDEDALPGIVGALSDEFQLNVPDTKADVDVFSERDEFQPSEVIGLDSAAKDEVTESEMDKFKLSVNGEDAVLGILMDGIDEFQPCDVRGADAAVGGDEGLDMILDKLKAEVNGKEAVPGIEEFQLNEVLTPDLVMDSDGGVTRADAVVEAELETFHGEVNGGDEPVPGMLMEGIEDEFQLNDVPRLDTRADEDFETTPSDVIWAMDELNAEAEVPGILIDAGMDEFQPEKVEE
jgi:hypothetical protein